MWQVIDRIERRGFIIERMEMLTLDEERLKEHYAQLVDKPFSLALQNSWWVVHQWLVLFLVQVLSSHGVIWWGATNPGDAAPGTIRGDFATAPDGDMIPNIVHGSDSDESAAREIKIWFGE